MPNQDQSFEDIVRQVVYKLGHEIVELASAASYEKGVPISVNHEAVNTHANIILAAHNADRPIGRRLNNGTSRSKS